MGKILSSNAAVNRIRVAPSLPLESLAADFAVDAEADRIFEAIDTNGDQRLSIEELAAVAQQRGITADWPLARIKESIVTWDADQDGVLDKPEWRAAFAGLSQPETERRLL